MEPAGTVLREARKRAGITQKALALRTGVSQAAISRLERGDRSLTVETLERLLLAMGVQLELRTAPLPKRYDPRHLAAEAQLTPGERLERAFAWTGFNDELLRAGRKARS
jgi:transcriptional regulator with XRE-family HTH domain